MLGIPAVDDVRDWLKVSTGAVSDADLGEILLGELAIQFRLLRVPAEPDPGPVSASIDDMTATVAVDGGTPAAHFRISWGDGSAVADLTLDDVGAGTSSWTYASPGPYVAVVVDDAGLLLNFPLTVPGTADVEPEATYPEALARALLRRCQRNVAARAVPLGAFGVEGSEFGPVNLPAWDAEISRLESSYLIAVIA
jgi:hypothetical protein